MGRFDRQLRRRERRQALRFLRDRDRYRELDRGRMVAAMHAGRLLGPDGKPVSRDP